MSRSMAMAIAAALLFLLPLSTCYSIGDYVPMSRKGQYHSMRTPWHDQLGRHCPRFGVDREVVLPLPKPVGYTGADPYKVSFQVGKEKILTPWLFVIGRQSNEVPIIDFTLTYSGGDLQGVTAKVVGMPESYLEEHQDIKKQFWDPQKWPKHILVRYTWVERSEFDVITGLYILFGLAFLLTLITAIHILQSSKEKLARFMHDNVLDASVSTQEAKVE